MTSKGSPLGRDGGNNLLDRSKVRILLCDNDVKSSQEVLRLLYKCSYQVTSVRTARQVIDALNAEGPKIDIILTEVDLPIAKGLKMLKYIMRDTELRRIPIIMMSSQDEVSVVVKCLRLGAADYLVKPLRTNELLNLWTHMWRRRRMLGLTEKNILSHDFDLVASDPSDANTNSTTLFSDDTDEKSQRSTLPETSMSNPRDNEFNAPSAVEPSPENLSELQPSASEPCDFVGGILSRPKKSKLKVGESSAFFTYVKSSMPTSGSPRFASADENVAFSKQLISELELPASCKPVGNVEKQDETWESCSHGSHDNVLEVGASGRSSSMSIPLEHQGWNLSREQIFSLQVHSNTEDHAEVSGIPSLSPLPFCLPGMPNQIMMPPSGHLFQGNLHDVPKHTTSATLPQYNTLPPCPHIPMITPLHYYPVGVGMPPSQMPVPHMWPSLVSSSSSPEVKSGRVERREAALIKFRQKRKDRCFEKKIRYVNRKRLAEMRPRVRGQFVRQMNDFNVDLNGHPIAVDDSDEDEQEEEDEEDV